MLKISQKHDLFDILIAIFYSGISKNIDLIYTSLLYVLITNIESNDTK